MGWTCTWTKDLSLEKDTPCELSVHSPPAAQNARESHDISTTMFPAAMNRAATFAGYAAGLYLAGRILSYLLRNFYAKVLARPLDPKKLGSWALVTGATDGIGKAYAMNLAARGINVFLVSRSLDKLQTVAAEIESKHKVKVKVLDIDFATDDREYAPRLEREIDGLEIGTLVIDFPHLSIQFLEMEKSNYFF